MSEFGIVIGADHQTPEDRNAERVYLLRESDMQMIRLIDTIYNTLLAKGIITEQDIKDVIGEENYNKEKDKLNNRKSLREAME